MVFAKIQPPARRPALVLPACPALVAYLGVFALVAYLCSICGRYVCFGFIFRSHIWNLFFGSDPYVSSQKSLKDNIIPHWVESFLITEEKCAPRTSDIRAARKAGGLSNWPSIKVHDISAVFLGHNDDAYPLCWHLLNIEDYYNNYSNPNNLIGQQVQHLELFHDISGLYEYCTEYVVGNRGRDSTERYKKEEIIATCYSVPKPVKEKYDYSDPTHWTSSTCGLHILTGPMGLGKSQFLRLFSSQIWGQISIGDGNTCGSEIDPTIEFDFLTAFFGGDRSLFDNNTPKKNRFGTYVPNIELECKENFPYLERQR